jgi:hypothetical protein
VLRITLPLPAPGGRPASRIKGGIHAIWGNFFDPVYEARPVRNRNHAQGPKIFVIRFAGCTDNRSSPNFCQLNGHRTNSSGSSVNQNRFAFFDANLFKRGMGNLPRTGQSTGHFPRQVPGFMHNLVNRNHPE